MGGSMKGAKQALGQVLSYKSDIFVSAFIQSTFSAYEISSFINHP
jgi:hypothetical protein